MVSQDGLSCNAVERICRINLPDCLPHRLLMEWSLIAEKARANGGQCVCFALTFLFLLEKMRCPEYAFSLCNVSKSKVYTLSAERKADSLLNERS